MELLIIIGIIIFYYVFIKKKKKKNSSKINFSDINNKNYNLKIKNKEKMHK